MTEGKKSQWQRIKCIANPLAKEGGYFLPHAIISAIIGAIVVIAIQQTASHTQQWIKDVTTARKAFHPKGGVVVPNAPKQPLIIAVGGGSVPASGGINFDFFTGTDMQGDRSTTTCEAHAFSKALSYGISRINHSKITVSPRALFDDVTNGRMIPTAPQWYAPIARDKGIVRNKYFSYGPSTVPASFPAYSAEGPPLFLNVHRRKVNVTETFLWDNPAPGQGGIDVLRQQIGLHGRPVLLTMPMYAQSEANSWYTGYITTPTPGDYLDFYHGVICTRYQNNRIYHGEKGWVLCNNSWGPRYGVDEYGNFNPGHAGYFWLSYNFIKKYSLQALYLSIHSSPPIPVGGGSAPTKIKKDIFTPPYNPGPVAGGGGPWVHNVHYYNDARYQDISGIINDAAAANNISAVGLAATLGTESNLRPSAPHYPIAGAGACDYSGGISQFTVCTIRGYGVGDGSQSWANISYVLNWENTHPVEMIRFAANLLGTDKKIICEDFYPLYVAFNAGAYAAPCGSYWWFNPTGLAYSNLHINFLPWLNYANANWATAYRTGTPPPPPRIFPTAQWCSYSKAHHRTCPSPYYRKHLGTVAAFWAFTPGVAKRLGAVKSHEQWHPKRRYMTTTFVHGVAYSWPTKKRSSIKIVAR